jgi:peptidoglycan hydrolase-like protein with peptidoglycan-binding domain
MLRTMFPAIVMLALGAALGPIAVTPATAQRGSASEAEDTAHWDRVKQAKSPDAIRGYLDRFPNGLYAPLARIRLKNMDSAGSSPRPPGGSATLTPPTPPPSSTPSSEPRPSSTASVLTDRAAIREVQDLLYKLNYQIGPQDGRLTSQTRDAIRKWQANVKLPETGDMTVSHLALLRSAPLPTTWGALAYYTKGASATVWNRPSREIAEREALAECRKNAGASCKVFAVARNICAALGFYNAVVGGRQHWGVYASVRPTLGQATDHALSECRRQARRPNACGVRTTVCADGGHRR